jgi:hypothetical protein
MPENESGRGFSYRLPRFAKIVLKSKTVGGLFAKEFKLL